MLPRLLRMEPPFYRLMEGGCGLTRHPLGLGYLAAAVAQRTTWEIKIYHGDFALRPAPFKAAYLTGQGFRNYQANLCHPQTQPWLEGKG